MGMDLSDPEILKLFFELKQHYLDGTSDMSPFTLRSRRKLGARIDAIIKEKIRTNFNQIKDPARPESHSFLSFMLQDTEKLTPHILDSTAIEVRMFLMAGHDTVAILLQWLFYELSRNPRVRALVAAELDEIFGPNTDPEAVREVLLSPSRDASLKRLTYTSAVIKEALRMWPPAATGRGVPRGGSFTIRLPDGQSLEVNDRINILVSHAIIHRNPNVWGETANDFIPERWLDGSEADIPAGAWRAFERGPRNCIGQELALIEAKVILACSIRHFRFTKVGLGQFRLEDGKPVVDAKGRYEVQSEIYTV